MAKKRKIKNTFWTILLSIAAILWMYPVIMILLNSLKQERAISTNTAFALPTAETFAGISNYIDSITSKGFLSSLGYSLLITRA